MIEYCIVVDQSSNFVRDINQKKTQEIAMEALLHALKAASNLSEKLEILDKSIDVKNYLDSHPVLKSLIEDLSLSEKAAIKALLAIGQGEAVFQDLNLIQNPKQSLKTLSQQLLEIEKFYGSNGGIAGYHLAVLKLLSNREQTSQKMEIDFEMPPGLDISKKGRSLDEAVRWGIHSMRIMGEMYPVGGAGDRLNLKDEKTGELLPAAQLLFCGRTLLELLIRDLFAREFLHYKLFDEQLITPVAIMTSHEKNNHQRILEICEANHWFARPEKSYNFFIQPLVPVVTLDGKWAISSPMQLILKPGGHGVIWKAALEEGVFDWFAQEGRKKILVRQINNPLAGIDSGLLALSGIGCKKDKDFGFASCKRAVAAAEGMDVLKSVKTQDGYEYCITNVEYTNFKQFGIEDAPEGPESLYSRFPANTNILFGDLKAIKKAVDICPLPGMIINPKNRVKCYTQNGFQEKFGGRLESTMQNIADYMTDRSSGKLSKEEALELRTFLTYNERRKTISVTKQAFTEEKPLNDTPEACFYDLMNNYRDLLINYCQMQLPLEQDIWDYLEKGPDCLIDFHPALGPLYSVIGQKIRGGRMAKGSEWILEISEASIVDLDLDGSLIIEAENVMGRVGIDGILVFDSSYCGKCSLNNLKVRNQGRVRTPGKNAWKCETERKEGLRITLHGNAEFFAENIELEGDIHFDVPEGHRLVVYQQGKEIAWHFEKIKQATWKWEYFFEEDSKISLQKTKPSR